MDKISILMCSERGVLENMSKILVASIRDFGGSMKDVPIYCFQPRKSRRISKSTRQYFKQQKVREIDLELNTKYQYYPLANKPLVCAWAEENISSEVLVFLDSDVVFFNEPVKFLSIGRNDVMINPVDLKGIGSSGEADSNFDYWKNLYSLLEISARYKITTVVDKENILPYWNSGQIVAHKSTGLFSSWLNNFEIAMSTKLTPRNGLFFVEQSTLSATILKLGLTAKSDDLAYGYPVHCHDQLGEDKIDLNNSVSWHYHDLLSQSNVPGDIETFFRSSVKGAWLKKKLQENNLSVTAWRRYHEKLIQFKNNIVFRHMA